MLERYVASILASYIGKYVKNLNKDTLKVSIWHGDVCIRNLELKGNALDSLRLPVCVHQGFFGCLKLRIPWNRLQSEPVVLEVDQLLLVIRPKKSEPWNEEEEQRYEYEQKQYQLDLFEAARETKQPPSEGEGGDAPPGSPAASYGAGFFTRLGDMILNNIQLKINAVHARYEDPDEGASFALGLVFENLSCVSTDGQWTPSFLTESGAFLHKLLSLQKFGMYVHRCPRGQLLSEQSGVTPDQWKEEMLRLITAETDSQVLTPSDASMKVRYQRSGRLDLSSPRAHVDALLSQVGICLDRQQYESLLQTVSYFSNFAKVDKFRRYRPTATRPTQDPRAWWQYAINSVLHVVRGDRSRCTLRWDWLLQRKQYRETYVALHKRKQYVEWLPPLDDYEEEEYRELEGILPLHDLIFFRKLAYSELKVEETQYQTQRRLVSQARPPPSAQPQGWMDWLTGRVPVEDLEDPEELPVTKDWTEEERQQLYAEIGLDTEGLPVFRATEDLPRDYVELQYKFGLQDGSVVLRQSGAEFAELRFGNFVFQVTGLPETIQVSTSLERFEVHNRADVQSPFACLVQRSKGGPAGDLVTVRAEKNPLDGRADFCADIAMSPLDVVLDAGFFCQCAAFFRIPSTIDLSDMSAATRASLQQLAVRAKQQLGLAWQHSSTLDLHCNMQAPNFILPESLSGRPAGCVVFAMGTFVLQTELDPRRRRRIADDAYVERDYYDHYTLQVSRVRALCTNLDALLAAPDISDIKGAENLVDDVSLQLTLARCLTPLNETLPVLKVHGDAPSVRLSLSLAKVGLLRRCCGCLAVPPEVDTDSPEPCLVAQVSACLPTRQLPEGAARLELARPCTASLSMPLLTLEPHGSDALSATVELAGRFDVERSDEGASLLLTLPQGLDAPMKCWLHFADSSNADAWATAFAKGTSQRRSWPQEAPVVVENDTDDNDPPAEGVAEVDWVLPAQCKLQATFTLHSLVVGLSAGQPERPLCQFQASHITVETSTRTFDTRVEFRTTTVEARCPIAPQAGAAEVWRVIMDSGPVAQGELITVAYQTVQPGSPVYDQFGASASMQCQFNTLNVVLCEEFVESLEVVWDMKALLRPEGDSEAGAEAQAGLRVTTNDNTKLELAISAHMQTLAVLCEDQRAPFLRFVMSDTSIDVAMTPSTSKVKGSLGNCQVLDCATPDTMFEELLGCRDQTSLINFSFFSNSLAHESKQPEHGGYYFGSSVKAQMQGVRFVWFQRIISRLAAYCAAGLVARLSQVTKDRRGDARADPLSLIAYEVEFSNPYAILPCRLTDRRCFQGDLGRIQISNRLVHSAADATVVSRLQIMFADMKLHADSWDRIVIPATSLFIQHQSCLVDPSQRCPLSCVTVRVEPLEARFAEFDYHTFLGIYADNFCGGPASAEAEADAEEPAKGSANPAAPVRVTMEVSFECPALRIGVYAGEGDPPAALAALELEGLAAFHWARDDRSRTAEVSIGYSAVKDYSGDSPLVLFQSGQAPDAAKIALRVDGTPDGAQRLQLSLLRPAIRIIPDAFFALEDFFFSEAAMAAAAGISSPPPSTPSKSPGLSLAIRCEGFRVVCVEATALPFAELHLTGLELEHGSAGTKGHLMDVEVVDVGAVREEWRYVLRRSLSETSKADGDGADEAFLRFQYSALARAPRDDPQYTSVVEVHIGPARCVHLQGFALHLFDYCTAGPLHRMALLGLGRAERLARELLKETDSLLQLRVGWDAPCFLIPEAPTSNRFLTAAMAGLSFTNELVIMPASDPDQVAYEDKLVFLMRDLSVSHSGICIGQSADLRFVVVGDTDLKVELMRPVRPVQSLLTLRVDIGAIEIPLLDTQCAFLHRVVLGNLNTDSGHGLEPTGDSGRASPGLPLSPLHGEADADNEEVAPGRTLAVQFGAFGLRLATSIPHVGPVPVVSLAVAGLAVHSDPHRRTVELWQVQLIDERPAAAQPFSRLFSSDKETGQTLTVTHTLASNEVHVKVHQLSVLLVPEALAAIQTFFAQIPIHSAAYPAPSSPPSSPALHPVRPRPPASPDATRLLDPPAGPPLSVRAEMTSFSVGLVQEAPAGGGGLCPLATLTMATLSVQYRCGIMEGSIGDLIVEDTSPQETCYREVLGLQAKQESSLVSFHYTPLSVGNIDHDVPRYTGRLSVTMRSVRLVLLQQFAAAVQRASASDAMRSLTRAGTERAAKVAKETLEQMAKTVDLMQVQVEVFNPTIVVPESPTQAGGVVLDLGCITIANSLGHHNYTAYCETFTLSASQMKCFCRTGPALTTNLLEGVDLTLVATRAITNPVKELPDLTLQATLGDLHVDLQPDTYTLLLRIVRGNLGVAGTSKAKPKPVARSPHSLVPGATAAAAATAVAIHLRGPGDGGPPEAVVLRYAYLQLASLVLRIRHRQPSPDAEKGIVTTLGLCGIAVDYKEELTGDVRARLTIQSLHVSEVRPSATPSLRELLADSAPPAAAGAGAGDGVGRAAWCMHVAYSRVGAVGHEAVEINLGQPRLTFLPDAFLALEAFFRLPYYEVFAQHLVPRPVEPIVLTADFELAQSLILTPQTPLYFSARSLNVLELRGRGHEIRFCRDRHDSRPLIVIDPGLTVRVSGATLNLFDRALTDYIRAGPGSHLLADPTQNKFLTAYSPPPLKLFPLPFHFSRPGTALALGIGAQTTAAISPAAWATAVRAQARRREELPREPRQFSVTFSASIALFVVDTTPRRGGAAEDLLFRFLRVSTDARGSYTSETLEGVLLRETAAVDLERLLARTELRDQRWLAAQEAHDAVFVVEPVHVRVTLLGDDLPELPPSPGQDVRPYVQRLQVHLPDLFLRMSYEDALMVRKIAEEATGTPGMDGAPVDTTAPAPASPALPVRRQLEVAVSRLSYTLVDDSSGADFPLLDVVLEGMRATLHLDGAKSNAHLSLTAMVQYYNPEICDWEPLLEKVNLDATYGHEPTAATAPKGHSWLTFIHLASGWVNLNVTPAMLSTCLRGSALWTNIRRKDRQSENVRGFCTYQLVNQTGLALSFSAGGNAISRVPHGATYAFNFPRGTTSEWLSIELAGSGERTPVRVGRIGKSLAEISDIKLVVDVALQGGSKVVLLRSRATIHNRTAAVLNIQGVGIVTPNAVVPVPVEAIEVERLKVAPILGERLFHAAQLGYTYRQLALLSGSQFMMRCLPAAAGGKAHAWGTTLSPFICTVHLSTNPHLGDCTVTFLPTYSVRNLLGRPLEVAAMERRRTVAFRQGDGLFTGLFAGKRETNDYTLFKVEKATIDHGEQYFLTSYDPTKELWISAKFTQPGGAEVSSELVERHAVLVGLGLEPEEGDELAEEIEMGDATGMRFYAKLQYQPDRCVSVYSPYWVVNEAEFSVKLVLPDSDGQELAGQGIDGVPPASRSAPPFLISPTSQASPQASPHLRVLVGSSVAWSEAVPIASVGLTDVVSCRVADTDYYRSIGVANEFVGGPVGTLTKLLRLSPRWVLVNRTEHRLKLRQAHSRAQSIDLVEGRPVPLYTGHTKANFLMVTLADRVAKWSVPFNIDQIDDLHLKLVYSDGQTPLYASLDNDLSTFFVVRVSVFQKGAVTFVAFESSEAPYFIENRTDAVVRLQQKPLGPTYQLAPRQTIPFAWDDPYGAKALLLRIYETTEEFPLTFIKARAHTQVQVRRRVGAKQLTLTFFLTLRHGAGGITHLCISDFILPTEVAAGVNTSLKLDLDGLGVSFVQPEPAKEIAYLSLHQVLLIVARSPLEHSASFRVQEVQLDDQTAPVTVHPVVFAPAADLKRGEPFLDFSLVRTMDIADAYHIRYLELQMLPADFKLADQFLWHVWQYGVTLQAATSQFQPAKGKARHIAQWLVEAEAEEASIMNRKVYFERFILLPIQVNFTLTRFQDGDLDPFSILLGSYHFFIRSIDSAPVKCNCLLIENTADRLGLFTQRVQEFYRRQLLLQLHRMLGSLDALGNPMGLFTSLGAGVSDFFFEPIAGLTHGPQQFAVGVMKGSASLLQNTVHGAVNSFSKLTRSLGRSLATLTFDEEWLQARRLEQIRGDKALLLGSAFNGVVSGMGGLLTEPIKALRQGESVSLGLARGLVGAVLKPVTGVLDGITNSTEEVAALVADKTVYVRCRSPREFYPLAPLQPYVYRPTSGYGNAAAASPTTTTTTTTASSSSNAVTLPQPNPLKALCCCRCKEVLRLKAQYNFWQRFLDRQIPMSFVELAHHTTWNEFHANLPPDLFYQYADLARDQYVVTYSLDSPLPTVHIDRDLHRRQELEQLKRELSLPELKKRVRIEEFAACTTWQQFHSHCTPTEFYRSAWLARDNCFAETVGFTRL